MYGIGIWGSIIKESERKMLYMLQKKLLRTINKVGSRLHCLPIHRKYAILTLSDQISLEQLKLIHRYVFGTLPLPLKHLLGSDHSSYDKRASYPPVPKHSTNLMGRSFLCKAIMLWQNCDIDIKRTKSRKAFTKKVKLKFIRKY